MYICNKCDTKFDQPDTREYAERDDAYGSSMVFYVEEECCPHCYGTDFDEYYEECDEECDEQCDA
jgi:hypothetical protein